MSLPNGNPLVIFLESIKGKSRTGVGLAILLSVALAMVWANSPYGDHLLKFMSSLLIMEM